LAFKSFHYEFTWWRLFQKRVVCTKLDTVQPILCDLPREQWNMVRNVIVTEAIWKLRVIFLLVHMFLCIWCNNKNVDTVKPALVTTAIKQHLVLCDLRFYFPSQCISYQLNIKRLLNYLAFKSYHYECTKCTWWRLLQKRVVCTKLDTVKPILCDLPREQWNLVTTSIKQHLVLCDLRFYFPS
jgi:hypothetical protein